MDLAAGDKWFRGFAPGSAAFAIDASFDGTIKKISGGDILGTFIGVTLNVSQTSTNS